MAGNPTEPVAYVISAVEGFVDEATVGRYAELTGPAIEQFDGRFIVSNTQPVVVEGESPRQQLSIVQFPSMTHANAWYDSPEYAEARALTPAAFTGRLLMFVEGVDLAERPD
ncbi:MAG: DUF1330 domain-containing protein [Solirubrobacterales bacterium]|nr:DUF1330 domain-containing protein [Solirubrobacterales bacterium]